jgi:hypothetical protein
VVRCLAAAAVGDDRELLDAYADLEADPRPLPCDPVDVYRVVTEARLRTDDLDAITQGVIPDEVADLADPTVRRLMAIAYARRAVRDADRDPASALRDIEQALELASGDPGDDGEEAA